MSFTEAYEIVLKALKAIAGKAMPEPKPDTTLEQLGIADNNIVLTLKNQIIGTLQNEGYEFQKMSLNEIKPETKVNELADLVKYAVPKSTPRMY
jgi:hypothetical protein